MKNLLGVLVIIAIVFTSCIKGDTGPQGPPGANGVANLVAYDITVSDWSFDLQSNEYYAQSSIPEIDQNVIDAGLVQAYISDPSFQSFTALPTTESLLWINYTYFLGGVEFDWGLTDGTAPSNPGTQYFKVVVIPPAVRLANPDVKWNDFNEVQKHFHIIEVSQKSQTMSSSFMN